MQKTCKSCGDIFSADQDWKTMCIPCYIKWKKASENTDSPQQETKTVIIEVSKPLPLDMLNRLIRLCHPDRHKCSEAAHIATVWLLAEREKSYQAGVE